MVEAGNSEQETGNREERTGNNNGNGDTEVNGHGEPHEREDDTT